MINAARLEIARSIAANKVADKELKDDTPLVANAPELPEEQAKYLPEPPPEYTPHDVRFKMPGLTPAQVNHFLAHYAPPVLDPFAGGGSIPLEAQRLGLRAYASDLNPVPVLINKALIEIPPKFAGQPPVNPDAQKGKLKNKVWNGAEGLADDVRYYGKWMRDEAEKRIGHLYPKVKVTEEMAKERPDLERYVGQELTVIAWLWARTVPSSNPAANGVRVPLIKSFWLCTKPGSETYIEPIVDRKKNTYEFKVRRGKPKDKTFVERGTKLGRGASFRCLLSDAPIDRNHLIAAFRSKQDSECLLAIVVEGNRERLYVSPIESHVDIAHQATADSFPEQAMNTGCTDLVSGRGYGIEYWYELFTKRQLHSLTTLISLIPSIRELVAHDVKSDGLFREGYSDAIATYLAFCIDKSTLTNCKFATWQTKPDRLTQALGRQALPMSWDYAEANPTSNAGGGFGLTPGSICEVLENLPSTYATLGMVKQADAANEPMPDAALISTDPPYYDNISYADLSDYFYVWLRKSVAPIYPTLFSTMMTPKVNELVASRYRHNGNIETAKAFFEAGLSSAIGQIRKYSSSAAPVSIFYAFRQSESDDAGVASTGWETFLAAVIRNGFSITATWPMRTELTGNLKKNVSALASSIVLACVPRQADAPLVTRRDFANDLRQELPQAIRHLQSGNVAPVDLAQASIGPGMAVFSRYKQVVNADGTPMTVREALQMINQVLDEALHEQEADFDADTRFAVRWFEQYGMNEGPYGDAETLAKAMAVAVSGVVEAGILASKGGKVQLLKREDLAASWNPKTDARSPIWECTQHLIRRLETGGEQEAAELLADIQEAKGGEAGEVARELSYRLYSTCERKGWAAEARSYNGLVVSWPEIGKLAHDHVRKAPTDKQREMFES